MTKLGFYVGNDPAALGAAQSWLGRPADMVLNYLDERSWAAFDSSVSYEIGQWKDAEARLMLSVPLTVNGTSLEQVATGADNSHFLSAAQAIASSRSDADPIYVRVGWEFNGDWMPWSAGGHEAAFVSAYQQLVSTFRSVSNQFKFVWDVNLGGSLNPETAYPGDAYVDVVGMDVYYDTRWDPADPASAFQSKVSQPFGLRWQQDFAAAHGKDTAISEWGVKSDGAGDYIQRFADWMTKNHMLFANYWEDDAAGFNGKLHDNHNPASSAAFLKAFGPHASASPPPPVDDTLVLRVSGDSYKGDPHFVVTVDGRQVGGVQAAGASHQAGQVQDVVLAVPPMAGQHEVAVRFVDDLYGGSAGDRNLYVHELRWGGQTYAGDEAANDAGWNSGGTANMFSGGQAVFRTGSADTLSIRVSGDSYRGDPHFIVTVDGQQVGGVQVATASHAAGQAADVVLQGTFGTGAHDVAIRFIDDLYGGSSATDRNLYVHSIALHGATYGGETAHNEAGYNSDGIARLYSEGQVLFHTGSSDWHI
ncbi:MAG: hypothetical protein JO048_02010 [Methylobacteriaceae bacterium]|nr:hypothetical protein [Methylobacteriaceae bacterium]